MNKKELETYLERQGWYLTADKALDLAEHVLIFLTDKMIEEEPYAEHEIAWLQSARDTVVFGKDD